MWKQNRVVFHFECFQISVVIKASLFPAGRNSGFLWGKFNMRNKDIHSVSETSTCAELKCHREHLCTFCASVLGELVLWLFPFHALNTSSSCTSQRGILLIVLQIIMTFQAEFAFMLHASLILINTFNYMTQSQHLSSVCRSVILSKWLLCMMIIWIMNIWGVILYL